MSELTAGGIGVLLVGAVLAVAVLQMRRNLVRSDTPDAPIMDLAPGQKAFWNSTLSSRWLALLSAGIVAVGVGLLFVPDLPILVAGLLVLAGLLAFALSSIHVTADAAGLHVKYGVLPWPSTHIDVDQIETASVIDVRPTEWGGWGYRGTLKFLRQAAVVLRAGPGIRLDLNDGRVFVVTVDNPEPGVALLNGELARR